MSGFRRAAWPLLSLFLVASASASHSVAVGRKVFVNGVPVGELRTRTVSGASPEVRAAALARFLGKLSGAEPIEIKKIGRTHALMTSGVRFLTFTPQEAAAQRASTATLATGWAARIKRALGLPDLVLSSASLRLAAPSRKFVPVVGPQASVLSVLSTDPSVATGNRVPGGLEIQANGVGTAEIRVQGGAVSESIEVNVRPYAANLPQTLAVFVAGSPALASTIEGAVRGAVKNGLVRQPGTELTLGAFEVPAQGENSSRTIAVPVRVTGGDAFDRAGTVNVVVRNGDDRIGREGELWYSNDPETVRRPGPLFSAPLRKGASARLLYHHINESGSPLYLRVQVVNDSDSPARVLVAPGDSEPDKNPVKAGWVAARQFFRAWPSGTSEGITIPPRSTLPISLRRLDPQETASGLCGLRLLDGPPSLLVRTDAFPPFPLEPKWQAAVASSTPWREVGCNPIVDAYDRTDPGPATHVYPDPFRTESKKFAYSGGHGFIRIGERPIARVDNSGALEGNFGVIYKIEVELTNPTDETADIELVFRASAGYSGGLFLVDGAFVETPLLQPQGEFRIGRFRIPAGGSRRTVLHTIPLSGSSYPSTVEVRPVAIGPALPGVGK